MGIYEKKRRSRRGSALMVVAYLGLVLAGVVGTYFYSTSQQAATDGRVRENAAGAQITAEFANEIAIAQLRDLKYKEEDGKKVSIIEDWVAQEPFGATGLEKAERRFSGTIGNYDYRTVVRSIRAAKDIQREMLANNDPDAPPKGWLASVEIEDYDFGNDPVWGYTGVYEIISSAHNKHSGEAPDMKFDASVRTLVSLDYNSINKLVDELAVLHADHPQLVSGSAVSLHDGDANGYNNKLSPWHDHPVATANAGISSVQVYGEDHYSTKASVKESDGDETVIETWETIRAQDSELFSVTNAFWDKGKMTLHYRLGDIMNPQVPRTINFNDWPTRDNSPFYGNKKTNTAATRHYNQQMIARFEIEDKGKPAEDRRKIDQYVYGGKSGKKDYEKYNPRTGSALMYLRGRSVSLDADTNTIKQLTEEEVDPDYMASAGAGVNTMTTTTLAVGKTENIFNLYFNLVDPVGTHSHPDVSASDSVLKSWTESWRQQSLGYFSRRATRATGGHLIRQRRPLNNVDSPRQRRWATLLWVKNEKGQFLVREYSGDYNRPDRSQVLPDGEWRGTYRWAYYGGYNGSYLYHLGCWIDYDIYSIGDYRNYEKHLNTRFLTMDELLGEEVEKLEVATDGLPADGLPVAYDPDNPSKVIGGVPKFKLDPVTNARIPYDPRGDGSTTFDEVAQRVNTTDNWGITTSGLSKMPPPDGIYVLVEDGGDFDWTSSWGSKYKRYATLKDFSYPRNVANEGEPEDIRNVTSLHMVLEIDPETEHSYPYFKMGLTVAMVYPNKTDGGKVDPADDAFLVEVSRQWWEGDHAEGMTGEDSHFAVSSHMDHNDPKVLAAKTAESAAGSEHDAKTAHEAMLKAYLEQFGFVVPEEGHSSDEVVTSADEIYTMLDPTANKIGFGMARFGDDRLLMLDYCGKYEPDWVFYYGQEELWNFIYMDTEENPSMYAASTFVANYPDEWAVLQNDAEAFSARLEEWREEVAVAQMKALNDAAYSQNCTFRHVSTLYDIADHVKASLSKETMESTFKFAKENVTARYLALQAFGFNEIKTPAAYVKLEDDGTLRLITHTDIDPNSSEPGPLATTQLTVPYLAGEILPVSANSNPTGIVANPTEPYVPLNFTAGELQANGRPLESRFIWESGADADYQDVATLHNPPSWLLGNGTIHGDLFTPLVGQSPAEHRGAFGWHRKGPQPLDNPAGPLSEDDINRVVYGDHFEFTLMARKGFNPYYTTQYEDGYEYIALFCPADGDPTDTNQYRPRLKSPALMPTFTIRNPASPEYSSLHPDVNDLDGAGILVVAGNLDIRTRFAYHGLLVVLGDLYVTPEEAYVMDEQGNYLNAEGKVLKYDPITQNWNYLDDNGNPKASERAYQWLGELIAQGKVVVGGNIYSAPPTMQNGVPHRPAGKIDIRGSRQAIEETVGLWSTVAPNEGFTANRIGWSSGAGSANFDLWKD